METTWDGTPTEEVRTSPQESTAWRSSPGARTSPVSDLAVGLGNLHCCDSATPRRKLTLTPEIKGPSPLSKRRVSQEMKTPTGTKRKGERLSSPRYLLSKMRQMPEKKTAMEAASLGTHKENRRLRVRLSSHFPARAPGPAPALKGPTRSLRAREECTGCNSSEDIWHAKEAWLPRWQVQCQLGPHLLDIPDSLFEDRNLVGDFSEPYALPMERSVHQDLRAVSAHTVAALLNGKYSSAVQSYLIVDCRYPYEYQGGKIVGAVNLHSEDLLQEALFCDAPQVLRIRSGRCTSSTATPSHHGIWTLHTKTDPSEQAGRNAPFGEKPPANAPSLRKLIVFYCEFSSQRGPQLCRYLRKLDRSLNVYPQLFYPELYILEGGYKEFQAHFLELCDPPGYVPMLHRDFKGQLHRFQKTRRTNSLRLRRAVSCDLHS